MPGQKYQYAPKKEPIKKRTISIYLPTIVKLEVWKKAANASDMTLSKFIQEHVDNSLRDEYSPGTGSRRKLQQRIEQLEGELASTERQIRRFDAMEEKMDRVLRHQQIERFAETDLSGKLPIVRRVDRELIDIFKRRGFVAFNEVLGLLKIKPHETNVVKGIDEQLNILDVNGLLEKEATGWRYRG